MAEAWTVEGVELPEAFAFPITKLGLTSDIHGEGSFVNTSPTRVKCHVHVEARPESREGSARLEILPSPLHPGRGTELEVAYEFEQQFSLPFGCIEPSHPELALGLAAKGLQSPGRSAAKPLQTFCSSPRPSSIFMMTAKPMSLHATSPPAFQACWRTTTSGYFS